MQKASEESIICYEWQNVKRKQEGKSDTLAEYINLILNIFKDHFQCYSNLVHLPSVLQFVQVNSGG